MAGGTPTTAGVISPVQPCAGMDQAQPKLCEQHCAHDSQSVDTQPHSTIGAPVLPLMMVAVQADPHRSTKLNACGTFQVTVVEPPPLVRFGVLRI